MSEDRPPEGTPVSEGEKRYGRPAPGGYNPLPAGERRYGKPAPAGSTPAPVAVKPFSRPAPAGAKPFSRPAPAGAKPFSRPAPAGAKPFTKPAPARAIPHAVPNPLPGINARRVAIDVLLDVTRAEAFASLALSTRLRASNLPQRERALISELVYGTLERRLTLDYYLNQRLLKGTDIDPIIREILRVGLYQLLFLRIPDHAAIDESVSITKTFGREPFAALVNAVLRGIARDRASLRLPDPALDPVYALSIRVSVPAWVVRRMIAAYGQEEAERILSHRPDLNTITVVNVGKISNEAFEKRMTQKSWDWTALRLPGFYAVMGTGDIGIDQDYLNGTFTVLSLSSALVCMAVAPQRGQQILDCCAAPGGKTLYLSHLMQGSGRVQAWDLHDHRVELLTSMVERLHLDNVRPIPRDATILKPDLEQTMDAVLLDAPCSGLGVSTSKPDILYRQQDADIQSLIDLQKSLLSTVWHYVKIGGTLVYATCTLLPEENGMQIENFLKEHPQFIRDEEGLQNALPAFIKDQAQGGELQLLPYRDGLEGFYMARLKRVRA